MAKREKRNDKRDVTFSQQGGSESVPAKTIISNKRKEIKKLDLNGKDKKNRH